MIRHTLPRLPAPKPEMLALDGIARTPAAHDAHCAGIPALQAVEFAPPPPAPLAFPIRVAAWNLERCLDPAGSAAALAGRDLVLLSEMDDGMARTAQAHTTAEVAARLGMGHAYAVEFLELGLGSPIEHEYCTDAHNARGFHGNAVLARAGLTKVFALRLFGRRQWFLDAEQPRLGERVAVGGVLATEAGPIVTVSTHFESACGPAHRAAQAERLIAALDAEFPGMPVLIGGDLNTGNCPGGDWRDEGLFDLARAAGYSVHGGPEAAPTTRPSRLTRFPDRAMKLDWFLARGLVLGPTRICPALDPAGVPLSDHERIETEILGLSG
ncbi:MAG: endonuclease [Sphingomonadales bacterium]|nr:endonuclease [Sphingomonadales bacterium]